MKLMKTMVAVALALSLGACATQPTQQQTGSVVGGVLGGLLGTQVGGGRGQTAAIIAGTLAGAAIGGSIGRNMDETDQRRVHSTLETTPDNRTVAWSNPNTGNQFETTPTRTFQSAGQDCREYRVLGEIDGRTETIVGTACRDAQGRWINQ
ncbi:MAG: glycine zipper 2TM domain-containing protein [Thioalkalivibrio sp.]|nr:MAG: glycine zipper 2TM domain-containing protein [Thioalkalivibrio sp.]